MTRPLSWACAILFAGGLLLAGCKGTSPSPGEFLRTAWATFRPQAQTVPETGFTSPGDHWNDEQGIPWPVADSLGQVCKLAYASQTEVNKTLSGWGFATVAHFPKASLYAFVASDDRTVLVAFRGTDDLKDWLVNTDVAPQVVAHGIIHRGFYQGMKMLYPDVTAAISAQGGKKKNVWVTGHSLGGALAVAFAYESLAEGKFKPSGVVTFGQPLLADSALGSYLCSQLGGNYVRFVHGRDIVTRVLPGYVHCGKLVWMHDGKVDRETRPAHARLASDSQSAMHPELEPLSTAEFESLRQGIHDLRQAGKTFDLSSVRSYEERLVALADHFMDGYLGSMALAGQSTSGAATPAVAKLFRAGGERK